MKRTWFVWPVFGLLACCTWACFSPGYASSRHRQSSPARTSAHLVLRAKTETYHGKWTRQALDKTADVLRKRLDLEGVSQAVVTVKPPDKILLDMPRLPNETAFLNHLLAPADLRFYLLPQMGDRAGARPAVWSVRTEKDRKTGALQDVLIKQATGRPLTSAQLDAAVFNRPPLVSSRDLLPDSRVVNTPADGPCVEFDFNANGARILEEVTRTHIGQFLAVFLDKRLLTVPSINGVIPGKGIIEANFTPESAKELSNQINAGALPVALERVSQHSAAP